MAGIENDVQQIRQALYGRDVREAIAHGIEQCFAEMQEALEALNVIENYEIATDDEIRHELGISSN